MSILRQFNYLGQMRLDVPHFKSIESSIAYDFDLLGGNILAGEQPLVVKGLTIATSNTVGYPAENLLLSVENAVLMHPTASEAGTIYSVPEGTADEQLIDTNSNVVGAFEASSTNYVGIDLIRSADENSVDLVKFLDSDSLEEVSQTVPLSRILKYKIYISTQSFGSSPNIIPIAKVVTDASYNVVSVTDSRNMLFRLADGGDSPLATSKYSWGTRLENGLTYTGSGTGPFIGEDKNISSLKSWMDAIMTSIWEMRGGEKWYSPQHAWNVKMIYGPIVTLTDNWVFAGGLLKWEAVKIAFENAETGGIYYNTVTDETTGVAFGSDGMCLYVDLVRESNATFAAQVGTLQTLGSSSTPGRRYVLAWRVGGQVYTRDRAYEVGRAFDVATNTTFGMVKLDRAAANPADPKVIGDRGGTISPAGLVGLIVNASTSGDVSGIGTTGKGYGNGISALGGDTTPTNYATRDYGAGVWARGGNNAGVGGVGVYAIGGDNTKTGVTTSTRVNAGVYGIGTNSGEGVIGLSANSDAAIGVLGEGSDLSGGPTYTHGVKGIGKGTGYGVKGTGGPVGGSGNEDGTGVVGIGGGGNSNGMFAEGKGSKHGLYAISSAGSVGSRAIKATTFGGTYAIEVDADASVTNAYGIKVTAKGNGWGIEASGGSTNGTVGLYGTSSATNGNGVQGIGKGTGTGVYGETGSGIGVEGKATAANGTGVRAEGSGAGIGLYAKCGDTENATTAALVADSGSGANYAVIAQADTSSPKRAALRIVPQDTEPVNGQVGDLYVKAGDQKLYICTTAGVSGGGAVWVVVGSQTT